MSQATAFTATLPPMIVMCVGISTATKTVTVTSTSVWLSRVQGQGHVECHYHS